MACTEHGLEACPPKQRTYLQARLTPEPVSLQHLLVPPGSRQQGGKDVFTLEFVPEGWLQNGLGDPPGGLPPGDLGLSCGRQLPLCGSLFSLFLLHEEAEGLQGREEQFLPLLDPCLPAGLTALHDLLVEGQVDVRWHGLCPELPVALGLLLSLPLGLLPLLLQGSS